MMLVLLLLVFLSLAHARPHCTWDFKDNFMSVVAACVVSPLRSLTRVACQSELLLDVRGGHVLQHRNAPLRATVFLIDKGL